MKRLPQTSNDLLALPPPSKSWLSRARCRGSFEAAKHFLRYWKNLSRTTPDGDAQLRYTCTSCGQTHELNGTDVWSREFFIAGVYYDFAVRRLLGLQSCSDEFFPPGLNLNALISYGQEVNAIETHQTWWARHIIRTYLTSLVSIYFTSLLRRTPRSNLPTPVFERTYHGQLVAMHKCCSEAPERDLRRCGQQLLGSLLGLGSETYEDESGWNKDHRSGPYSAIHLPDLAKIARRDRDLVSRYGKKHLEIAFEQQLSLILQSFGFIVVQTKRGDRTVDLVCLSGDPREQATILIEAKSTGKAYQLPADDQRALLEYVADVQKNLLTLPALRLVLIVGPTAGRNLEKKLAETEAKARVPVRFISAKEFAELREMILGPLPVGEFLSQVLSNESRIIKEIAKPIFEAQRAVHTAHSNLVRTLLAGASTPHVELTRWDEGHELGC